MRSVLILFLASLLLPSFVFGACVGCEFASTYGTVTKGYKNAADDIVERFDELEEAFEKAYEDDIVPLVEVVESLEEELKVTIKQIEVMIKLRLIYERETVSLVKEIKALDETIDFTREVNLK